MRYEGSESLGQLIISEPHHPNVTITVELAKPVALSEYRKIRKLLQTADQSTSIISDGNEVFGLGRLTGQYSPKDESLYIIQFVDHYHWVATHNNQPLMRCKYGLPGLVREGIDRGTFQDICTRLFAIAKPRINQLYEIAMAAIHQQHGALVVISDGAAAEAERLKNQSFPIKPLPLTTQNVLSFSAIDGAVLVDTKAICHAIGVILDGPATSKGDASRGSRYNSAVRYVEFIKPTYPCLIIVVSEDGMVDLIPNLKPRIQRSTIDDRIQQFVEITRQTDPDRKRFYKLNSFFEDNAFYLSVEDCKLINEHRKSIESKLMADGSLTITKPDLYPDEDMESSYYS